MNLSRLLAALALALTGCQPPAIVTPPTHKTASPVQPPAAHDSFRP